MLLAVAAYALIGMFSGLDLATFAEDLREASWAWLALALVLAQVRLQQAIDSASRATVTSFAALAEEVTVFAVYGAWAAGGLMAVAVVVLAVAALSVKRG